MSVAEKIAGGLTIIAVFATIFTSPYSSSIFGSASGGLAKVYTAVKH